MMEDRDDDNNDTAMQVDGNSSVPDGKKKFEIKKAYKVILIEVERSCSLGMGYCG
jgi:hypothetical protein